MAEIKDKGKFHIFSSAYVKSAVNEKQYVEDEYDEIAFIGRSNVGKSSLINSLCGNKKLARVSREPGKTRTINYYAVQSRKEIQGKEERQYWYLVDLPGYGFAKTSQKNKDMWSNFISEYIYNSKKLTLICMLVDLRHVGLPIDKTAYEWLMNSGVDVQIIGTKADKLGKNERRKNLAQVKNIFQTVNEPIAYSSLKNEGHKELLGIIEKYICK